MVSGARLTSARLTVPPPDHQERVMPRVRYREQIRMRSPGRVARFGS